MHETQVIDREARLIGTVRRTVRTGRRPSLRGRAVRSAVCSAKVWPRRPWCGPDHAPRRGTVGPAPCAGSRCVAPSGTVPSVSVAASRKRVGRAAATCLRAVCFDRYARPGNGRRPVSELRPAPRIIAGAFGDGAAVSRRGRAKRRRPMSARSPTATGSGSMRRRSRGAAIATAVRPDNQGSGCAGRNPTSLRADGSGAQGLRRSSRRAAERHTARQRGGWSPARQVAAPNCRGEKGAFGGLALKHDTSGGSRPRSRSPVASRSSWGRSAGRMRRSQHPPAQPRADQLRRRQAEHGAEAAAEVGAAGETCGVGGVGQAVAARGQPDGVADPQP